jgi:hypothetical protein
VIKELGVIKELLSTATRFAIVMVRGVYVRRANLLLKTTAGCTVMLWILTAPL